MASSQHRCVFVGNIPYDATEEQLIEICQEVGPVVSFRLVIDRETGKPKGYGFCEYKDEETALSARRNLQGYEINGRQLRVDFAENDKGADRSREQGRGGPGLATNFDPQKQLGGSITHGDSSHHQPIGLHIAITAATAMAGVLGGGQVNQSGLHGASTVNDPLTLHLAKLSRSQLTEVISNLKVMATQNKEQARQLLLARPQLAKALFQAELMLGLVTPQMLQMSNVRQASGQRLEPPLHDSQLGQPLAFQTLHGLPPLAPTKNHSAMTSKVQDSQVSLVQNAMAQNQFSASLQLPQAGHSHGFQRGTFPGQAGISTLPSLQPQPLGSVSVRSQSQLAISSSLSHHQMQRPSLHQPGLAGAAIPGQNNGLASQMQSSFLPNIPPSDASFKPGPSTSSGIAHKVAKDVDRSVHDSSLAIDRPSKLRRLDEGRSTSFSAEGLNASTTNGSRLQNGLEAGSVRATPVPRAEEMQQPQKVVSQPQLPPDVESALLQQVLQLTPEQLSSLPPEQRQQVIQLQRALRGNQIQPS